jgi:ADP-ribose pyrophosphatase
METDGGLPTAPERRLSTRRGFDGKLLHVRVDTVRLASGRETVREVIEHPGSVAIIALTEDRRVILVRQYRYAAGRTLLEIPAGTLDTDESPAEAARRELIEETGFAPGHLTELVTYSPTAGYSSERMTLFLAEGCRPHPSPEATDEVIDVVTIPADEIRPLLLPGPSQLQDAKSLLGLFWLLNAQDFGLLSSPVSRG